MSLAKLRSALGRLVVDDMRDLSLRQLCLLIDCTTHGPQTVRGIAGRLGTSKPAITRAADRLEKDRLLVRQDDPDDRRSVLLVATREGVQLVHKFAGGAVAEAPQQAAA